MRVSAWRVAAAMLAAISLFISCSGEEKDGPRGTPNAGGSGGTDDVGGQGGEGGAGGTGGFDNGGAGGLGGSGGSDESRLSAIEGRVHDENGKPILGALIAIDGNFEDLRATASDGSFSFQDVGPTYRLTVSTERKLFDLYEMTTRRPHVDLGMRSTGWADLFLTIKDEDSLSGQVYAGMTVPMNFEDEGEYSVEWSPYSEEKEVDLVVLHAEGEGRCPHEYLGMGRASGLLLQHDGETQVEVDIDEPAPPTRDVTISWDLGGFTRNGGASLTSVLAAGAVVDVSCRYASPRAYRIPAEGGRFLMYGQDDTGRLSARKVVRVPEEGDSVEITFPDQILLELMEPADGTENTSLRPTLSWTEVPNATRQIVEVGNARRAATFILPGDANRLDLDDLGELGWQLMPNEDQSWTLYSLHSYEVSPEEAVESYLRSANAATIEFEYYSTSVWFKTGD